MKRMSSHAARIDRSGGMGGFLNPPTHPEHTISVEYDYGRSACCLSSAVNGWVADTYPDVAKEAADILDAWVKPTLESPEVQDWIHQILGYFVDCFRNPDQSGEKQWHASYVLIRKWDPMLYVNDHVGVHHIRHWYPEFVPMREHFDQAYWGEKPQNP